MTKTLAIILAISMTLSILAVSFNAKGQEEIKEVGLYLYDKGENGRLSANFPIGNNTTEIETGRTFGGAGGVYFGGQILGDWTSAPIRSSVKVGATLTIALWAKSDENARNVMFEVGVYVNDNRIATIYTEPTTLSSTPQKLIGSADADGDVDLKSGDKVRINIWYWAESDPAYLGQGGSSTLLLGSSDFDSQLTVKPKSSPLSIGTISAKADENVVVISTSINESFGADLSKLFYKLSVSGQVNGKTFSEVKTSGGGNSTTISFEWDYKVDGAEEGKYTINIGVSYDGKKFVQNSTQANIVFPKKPEENTGGFLGIQPIKIGGIEINPIVLIVGIVIIAGVSAGGFLMIKRKRANAKLKKVNREQTPQNPS